MFIPLAKFEFVVNGKSYQFLCDQNSPIPDFKEAIYQLSLVAGKMEEQAKAAMAQQPKVECEEKAAEPEVEVPQENQQEAANDQPSD